MRPVVLSALSVAAATALFTAPVLAADPVPPDAPLAPAPTPAPEPPPKPEAPKAKPFKGFKIATDDGNFSLKLGTHLQGDFQFFPGDENKAYVDQVRVRRFRPTFKATVFKNFDARWMIELAGSAVTVLDAVIETTHLDELRLRVGKDKSPLSYDHLQSSAALTFLELGTTAQLSGNRDLGIQLVGNIGAGLLDYQIGVFDGVADFASIDADTDDQFELEGRLTFKPFKKAGIPAVENLAIGVTGSFGEATGTLAAPSVPGYRTTGNLSWFKYAAGTDLATTVVAGGQRQRFGAHLDWRAGPFTLFGELLSSGQELKLGDTTTKVSNFAYQAYAAFLFTGDKADRAGVDPKAPFDLNGGTGAFELAVRWGQLTIDDEAFDAGLADATKSAKGVSSLTVGFNWYLNNAVKLQLNYERTSFDGGAGTVDAPEDKPVENFVGIRLNFAI